MKRKALINMSLERCRQNISHIYAIFYMYEILQNSDDVFGQSLNKVLQDIKHELSYLDGILISE